MQWESSVRKETAEFTSGFPEALKGERYRGAPVYFDGRLFAGSVNDAMVEFRFSQARVVAEPASRTATKFAYPGAMPSLSANGAKSGEERDCVEGGKQQASGSTRLRRE